MSLPERSYSKIIVYTQSISDAGLHEEAGLAKHVHIGSRGLDLCNGLAGKGSMFTLHLCKVLHAHKKISYTHKSVTLDESAAGATSAQCRYLNLYLN